MKSTKVGIIMGSDTDLAIFAEVGTILEEFGVPYEMTVASAHRAPNLVHNRGIKVIIAGAGGAAHLAGVAASLTTLPVIGIPIKAKNLDGLDSLLSTVNMPPGVPVATVGINAGKNAGLLALQILSISDKNLENKIIEYKKKLEDDNKIKGEKLSKIGFKKYLASPVNELQPRENK
ncbi:MAG: N5-carboxyaminoimidazole ribonucleotide mutase [Parcubacteria group bacterium GW2011_GWB1_37_13]|nr:MAG: N5-carboxyaminoimidazole ribonucleotide mutase [Parcubacteria group bacterium GW2011_GWB1_37_13]